MSLTKYLAYRTAGTAVYQYARGIVVHDRDIKHYMRMEALMQQGQISAESFTAQLVADTYGLRSEVLYNLKCMQKAGVIDHVPTEHREDIKDAQRLRDKEDMDIEELRVFANAVFWAIAVYFASFSAVGIISKLIQLSPASNQTVMTVMLILAAYPAWKVMENIMESDKQKHAA